jgi:hypothetical protein
MSSGASAQNPDDDYGSLTEMMTEDNSAQLSGSMLNPIESNLLLLNVRATANEFKQFWILRYEVQKLALNEEVQCDISARLTLLRRVPTLEPNAIREVKMRQVAKRLLEQSRVYDKYCFQRRTRHLLRRLNGTITAYRRMAQSE